MICEWEWTIHGFICEWNPRPAKPNITFLQQKPTNEAKRINQMEWILIHEVCWLLGASFVVCCWLWLGPSPLAAHHFTPKKITFFSVRLLAPRPLFAFINEINWSELRTFTSWLKDLICLIGLLVFSLGSLPCCSAAHNPQQVNSTKPTNPQLSISLSSAPFHFNWFMNQKEMKLDWKRDGVEWLISFILSLLGVDLKDYYNSNYMTIIYKYKFML